MARTINMIKFLSLKVPEKMNEILFNASDGPKIVSNINPFSYIKLRKNLTLYQNIDFLASDGILITFLLNFFNVKKTTRISMDMSSLFEILFKTFPYSKYFIIGAKPDIIHKSIDNIRHGIPNLNIIGFRHGYFMDEEEKLKTIEQIIELNPDYVVVGMGTPLQEIFSIQLKQKGYNGIIYTCGGFLHQVASNLNYFTPFQNKYGLRWFYRALKEPYVMNRLIVDYPYFFIIFILDFFRSLKF